MRIATRILKFSDARAELELPVRPNVPFSEPSSARSPRTQACWVAVVFDTAHQFRSPFGRFMVHDQAFCLMAIAPTPSRASLYGLDLYSV